MSGFKLIGIRPLKGCHTRFRKNLKFANPYIFYNQFEIQLDRFGSLKHIYQKKDTIPSLYNIKDAGNNLIAVNISAVVGQNGSGKSTLFEIFYYMIFIMGVENYIIKPSRATIERRLKNKNILQEEKLILLEQKTELTFIYKHFKAELYFEDNEFFYWLKFSEKLVLKRLKKSYISDKTGKTEKWKIVSGMLDHFFYTVSINYSPYGLNSNFMGTWIEKLFHKNDAYQTPIVINPMRDQGNININSEFHLGQSRILTNLTSIDIKYPEIINGKRISQVEFIIRPAELDSLNGIGTATIFDAFEQKLGFTVFEFFFDLASQLVGLNFSKNSEKTIENFGKKDLSNSISSKFQYTHKPKTANYSEIQYLLVKYVIRKVIKIVWLYPEYREDFSDIYVRQKVGGNDFKITILKNIPRLITKLQNDSTHITHKIKQALFTLKEHYFKQKWTVERDLVTGYQYCFKTTIDYEKLKRTVNKVWEKNRSFPNGKIAIVPCALGRPSFIVQSKDSAEKSSFYFLSSGELQFAFSIHSVYYHILNLNSIRRNKNSNKIKYSNLNLFFDEVELCFHPEFQRNYINEILRGLKQYKIASIASINMVFATHSPFILSDIPHGNILKIKKGIALPFKDNETTFGANIHDLLANDFFMPNGFIGKFAQDRIQQLFNELKGESRAAPIKINKEIIDIIGEPFLKDELRRLYFLKYESRHLKEKEINRLKHKIKELET